MCILMWEIWSLDTPRNRMEKTIFSVFTRTGCHCVDLFFRGSKWVLSLMLNRNCSQASLGHTDSLEQAWLRCRWESHIPLRTRWGRYPLYLPASLPPSSHPLGWSLWWCHPEREGLTSALSSTFRGWNLPMEISLYWGTKGRALE